MQIRAAVLEASGLPAPYAESQPLKISDVELAGPGQGEVLVRIVAAGLCHSDLSVIDGNRPRPLPMVLGHEAAGVIEELGPGVSDLAVGDHVVCVFVPSCGTCEYCCEGRPALCAPGAAANGKGVLLSGERRLFACDDPHDHRHLAINHHLGVSAFAQYATVARQSLVKIDRELDLKFAALFGCAVLTGVGAVLNGAKIRAGDKVAIIGLGGVGMAALLGARAAGAERIVAIDINERKLELARELGATDVFLAADGRRRGDPRRDHGRAGPRIGIRRLAAGAATRLQDHPPWRRAGDGRAAAAGDRSTDPCRQPCGGREDGARQLPRLVRARPRHSAVCAAISAGAATGRSAIDGRIQTRRHQHRVRPAARGKASAWSSYRILLTYGCACRIVILAGTVRLEVIASRGAVASTATHVGGAPNPPIFNGGMWHLHPL